MKKSILALAIFWLFSMVLPIEAAPWTDPSCDPPNCNTEGPVWVNPDTSQEGYIDLEYSDNASNVPVLQIIDSRTTAVPDATLDITSAVNDKPAIYGYTTGTGDAYGAFFDSNNNAGLKVGGGIKFAGLTNLNEPTYVDSGLLYYNTDSNLFKFYNGSQWVELDNQWTTNGDELYRSFAASASGQGVAIKSGDATDPNDNYNLDIFRKALSTGDTAAYARIEDISSSDYASVSMGTYETASNVLTGLSAKSTASDGIGLYAEGSQAAAYFNGNVGINEEAPAYDLEITGDVLVDDGSGSYGVYIGSLATAPTAQSLYLLENGSNGLIKNYLDNGTLTLQAGTTSGYANKIIISGGSGSDNVSIQNGTSIVNTFTDSGDLYIGQASSSDDDTIYFDSAGTESLTWDDGISRFLFSDSVAATEADLGGTAIRGEATNTSSGTNYGGYFSAAGETGIAVYGNATSTAAGAVTNYGGYFVANADRGTGVYGEATSTADYYAAGGYFTSSATRGRGVEGHVTDTSSTYTKYGGYFRADGATDAGVYAWATSGDASNYHYGVWGHADNTNGIGVYAYGTAYSGYFTDAPVVITDDGGPGGAVTVAGNDYALADGELYVEGDIESDGNVYADLFYDNNATSYYLDPSSSTSGRFYGSLQLGYGLSTDNDYLYFDQNAEYLNWDNTNGRFSFSDDLLVQSNLYTNANLYLNYDQTDTYVNLLFGTASSTASEYIQYNPSLDRFTISGDVYARTVLLSSDERMKKNIKDIDSALKIVSDLRPVSFNWKEDGKADYGFIAQEMYDVLPDLVVKPENEEDAWGIEYANLTAVLTAAIQEQQTEIGDQADEIAELRKEIEELKALIK